MRLTMPPFQCPHCKARSTNILDIVSIAGAGQHRQIKGKRRRVTHCRCKRCHHEWWSRHPVAVGTSDAIDIMEKDKRDGVGVDSELGTQG